MKCFSILGRNLRVELDFNKENKFIERIGVFCEYPIYSRDEFSDKFNQALELMGVIGDAKTFIKTELIAKDGKSRFSDIIWDSGYEYFDGTFEEDMRSNEEENNFGLVLESEINEKLILRYERV